MMSPNLQVPRRHSDISALQQRLDQREDLCIAPPTGSASGQIGVPIQKLVGTRGCFSCNIVVLCFLYALGDIILDHICYMLEAFSFFIEACLNQPTCLSGCTFPYKSLWSSAAMMVESWTSQWCWYPLFWQNQVCLELKILETFNKILISW